MSRSEHIAVVTPRFVPAGAVGGAETLLFWQARAAARAGRNVTLLSTCAANHVTWRNELQSGETDFEGMRVHLFRVNEDRDESAFFDLQDRIGRGQILDDGEEFRWLRNSVNSRTLEGFLERHIDHFDRIVTGPYLFGLTDAVSRIAPEKTVLVPCLHDEPFARVRSIAALFARVRGCLFNTEPERELAHSLFGRPRVLDTVVGMGLAPADGDADRFLARYRLGSPYVIYSGRREGLKGTPLLLDYMAAFRRRTGRDIRLVLTGSGEIDPPDTLRPAILDLGFVDEATKRDAMAGAAAFCHPSLNESLSIVLLEAWQVATPALVHACGKVLVHQCRAAQGGLWFRDYPEFECALEALLDDPALQRRLGAQGRAFVDEHYSPEAVADRLLTALDT